MLGIVCLCSCPVDSSEQQAPSVPSAGLCALWDIRETEGIFAGSSPVTADGLCLPPLPKVKLQISLQKNSMFCISKHKKNPYYCRIYFFFEKAKQSSEKLKVGTIFHSVFSISNHFYQLFLSKQIENT